MRLLALAIITGLALAAGVLGLGLNHISGSYASLIPEAEGNLTQPRGTLPLNAPSQTSAAHSNSNTEGRTVYLNGRLIQGQPTVLCTTNTHLLTALRQAVTIWKNALSGSLSFTANSGPFSVYPEVGGPPANCDDNKPTLDIDVVIVFEQSSGSSIYDSRKSREGELPRKFFETVRETTYPNPNDHATLLLRRDEPLSATLVSDLVPTLVHELGHALGLSDYKTCEGLRVGVPGSGSASEDPDLHNQHYALMYNAPDRLCRPWDQATVTGRDLRDLYEAYHVAPITNVRLSGNPTLNTADLTVRLSWGNGANELYHNASHIAVFSRSSSSSPWDEVETLSVGTDVPIGATGTMVDVPGADPIVEGAPRLYPTMFKIAGLTRGDIRWLGQEINDPVNTPSEWALDTQYTTGGVTYTEGDPTYLSGTLVDGTTVVNNPRVLSASLSPRYCWTGDQLVVSALPSGGSDDRTYLLKGVGETRHTEGATGPCGTTVGVQSFSVQGQWGTRTPDTILIDDIKLYARQKPKKLSLQFATMPSSCTASVNIGWTITNWSPDVDIWINGQKLTTSAERGTSAASCLNGKPVIDGFAIRSDGAGSAATTIGQIVAPMGSGPQPPEALSARAIPASFPGAYDVELSWGKVDGALKYWARYADANDDEHELTSVTGTGDTRQHTFPSLIAGSTYTFSAQAVRRRAATGWVSIPLTLPQDPRFQVTKVSSTPTTVSALVGGEEEEEDGATAAEGITFYYNVWLHERVVVTDGVSFEQRLRERSPNNRSSYTHTFRNAEGQTAAINPGRTYRVSAQLVLNGTPITGSVNADELAATFALSHTVTTNSATLSWGAVAGASGYEVRLGDGQSETESGTSHTFDDLSAGTEYTLSVRASYSAGAVSAWRSLKVTTTAAPLTLTVTPASSNCEIDGDATTLTWTVTGGTAPYTVTEVVGSGASTSLSSGTDTTGTYDVACPATVGAHDVVVTVTDSATTPATQTATVTLTATLATLVAPSSSSEGVTESKATLTWAEVTGADGYEVKRGASGTVVAKAVADRSHEFTGLTADTEYTLYVRAKRNSSYSEWSSVTVRTAPAVPAPTGLTAVKRRYNLTLSWNEVPGATRYEARIGAEGTLYPLPPTPREFLFRQLRPATEYEFQLRAVTAAGTSDWSLLRVSTLGVNDPQPARPQVNKPAAPSGLAVAASEREATLSWYAVNGATSYQVSLGLVFRRVPATQFSYRFGSLQPDRDYQFYVSASNSAGRSSISQIEQRTLAPAPALSIASASTTAQHCVAGATDVPIAWTVSGGTAPYTVSAGGDAVTGSATSGTVNGLCPATLGAGSITVTVTDVGVGDARQTAATTVAITSTAALAIAPDPATVSCVAGGTATVGWSVSGGTAPYAVQLDGAAAVTAASTSYQCPQTVGAVDLSLAATDASVPQQTAAGTVRVQVRSAADPTLTGRIRAQKLSDGRVEFEFRTSAGVSIQPSPARYATPSALTPGTWKQSSSFPATVDEVSYTVGRISVRLSCAGYIEVTLLLPDGTRESPAQRNFYYKTATVGAWQRSGELTVTLSGGASGTVAYEGALLEAAGPGAVYPPGVEGGLMAEASAAQGATVVSTAPCTPENLETANITSSGLTLSWDKAPGATSYQLKRTGATVPVAASGTTSHDFSGLTPETEYTLSVRSKRGALLSDWAELTKTTASASLPTGLEVREVSDTSATLHWTKASDASDYAVQLDSVEVSASVGDVDRYAFSGLTAKRAHRLGVAAIENGVKSAFVELTLLVPPSELSSTTTHESIALSWTVDAAATSAEVRLGESGDEAAADSSTAHTFDEDLDAATEYDIYVRARNAQGASAWAQTSATTDAAPLSLTASANPTSCETGDTVAVSWEVEGGTKPYMVSVDGRTASASPVSVTCQADAGTQAVIVSVTDAGSPQQSSTVTLNLTVTAATTTLTGRLRAQKLSDGRVEFEFRTSAGISLQPMPARYATPSALTPGIWTQSSSFSTTVDEVSYTVGRISVRLSCAGYIEVTLLLPDGTRESPAQRNFYYKTARVGAWQRSGELTVTLSGGASGTVAYEGELLEAAGPGAVYPPGVEGGLMAAADAAQGQTEVSTAPCTPENLETADITSSGLTLSWDKAPGAASYEVKRTGATTPVAASGATSHEFSGLAPETEYTLSVRSKRGALLSGWAEIRAETEAAPSLTGRLRARKLADGRVEVELRTNAGGSIQPTKRFSRPSGLRPGVWTNSESFTTEVDDVTYTVGQIAVRLNCAGYIEVTLLPSSGSRLWPAQRNFYYKTATVNAWQRSGEITVTLSSGASGSSSGESDSLQPAPPNALDPPGTDGGLMAEAGTAQGAAEVVSTTPCAPENLQTTHVSSSGLSLHWGKAAGATSYEVRLGSSGSVQTKLGTARSHAFGSLSAGTSYTFYVRATNASGASAWVSAQTTTLPPAPSGLTVSGVSASAATLNWTAARGATGYEVRLGSSGSVQTKLGTARSHAFGSLSAGTSYTLYVRARNASGASAWVSAQTTTAPPVPGDLSVSGVSASAATLNWTAARGATSYEVRQGSSGAVQTKLGTARSHAFGSLSAGTSYTLYVRARNASGTSAWVSATATTLAATVSVSGQAAALLRSDGRVEFAFRPTGGSRITPTSRFVTPSSMPIGSWRHSSVVRGSAGGQANLQFGRITVRRLNTSSYSYIDVCFTPQGASKELCPSPNNFRYETATVNSWQYTGTISFTLTLTGGASGAVGPPGELMETAPPGADDPPGAEGGPMDDEE